MHRVRFILLSVVLSVVAAACSPEGRVQREDGFVAVVEVNGNSGMDAAISGPLAVTESGCLGIAETDGGPAIPTVWPEGARLAGGGALSYGGTEYRQGDQISAAGGEATSLPFDMPAECEADRYFRLYELQSP